jgi:predicted transcriptional regulator of viral defense system
MPVRGLWVPVPPEFRLWGAPPGIELVEAMMRHLNAAYYVGWLTAAAVHGAAHHSPQVFQVAVDRQVRDREVGRTRFEFAQRDVARIPTVARPTRSGTALVSSPAATALDVAADVARCGGVDNAATVILELAEAEAFDILDVTELAPRFPAAAGRRVGWILERFAGRDDLDPLRLVAGALAATPSRLDPAGTASGKVDPRWLVHLNRELEPDA